MWVVYVSVIIAVLWVMEGTLKDINNNLSYLIELLDPNSNSANEQEQTKEESAKEKDNQVRSRKDLYK